MSDWKILRAVESFDRRTRSLDRIAPPPGVPLPDRLIDVLPALSPNFEAPDVLRQIAEVLELAPHGGLRVAIHAPPRWGKTELVLHAIAYWLRRDPRIATMLVQHTASLALSKSTRARALAIRAGVQLAADSRAKGEWLTADGGGLRAFGFDAGIIGHGCDVLVVDDPFAKISEVSSALARDRVFEDFRGPLLSRLEPDGSAIIVAQRLHQDDLSGRAVRELGFEYIAITPRDERGHSRWPSRFSDERLAEIQRERGPYLWSTQYEGVPATRDDALFVDPSMCAPHEIPTAGVTAIGVDLAHSARQRSDEHAAVALRRHEGKYYVVDMRARHATLTNEERNGRKVPGFTSDLRDLSAKYPGARLHMYFGGREDVMLNLLGKLPPDERVSIISWRADADKFIRAQPLAADWRAGLVIIPRGMPWTDRLVAHLAGFTGQPNGEDDITDALVAAHAALRNGGGRTRASGSGEGSRALDLGRSVVA